MGKWQIKFWGLPCDGLVCHQEDWGGGIAQNTPSLFMLEIGINSSLMRYTNLTSTSKVFTT